MSEGKHSFWTSLPGVMTGIASLITALVALFTFIGQSKDNSSSPADPSRPALVNLDRCKSFAGKWNWFIGGELLARKDGYIDWRKDPSDPAPVIVGSWTCAGASPVQVSVHWQNGITDNLTLSPDKGSISGVNSINVQVSGTRKH